MDKKKADYGTIILFSTLNDFQEKLKFEDQKLCDVIDNTDVNGVSLLGKALIGGKFDIAKYLLEENAKINIITKEGFNELHLLAANINFEGGIEIANLLLSRGVELTWTDKRYGNPAFFSLCLEIFKRRTGKGLAFIEENIRKCSSIDVPNKSGKSIRDLLNERGTDEMKRIIGEM